MLVTSMTKPGLTITLVLSFLLFISIASAAPTKVYVRPSSTVDLGIGQTFTIGINVDGVKDLYAQQFAMNFNPNVLECLSVKEGPFLKQGGKTLSIGGNINNTSGKISLYVTGIIGHNPGVNGNGTLATITFKVTGKGVSDLDLYRTLLLDSTGAGITHNVGDGYFKNTPPIRRGRWPAMLLGLSYTNILIILVTLIVLVVIIFGAFKFFARKK